MGKKKHKSRRSSSKFNRPGGFHSRTFKIKEKRKYGKLQMTVKSGKSKGSYAIKKRGNLKYTLSKLSVKKAKHFMCVRDENNLKLKINLFEKNLLPGSRIINLDNLQQYVSTITTHSATCQLAQKVAAEGRSPIKLICEERNGLHCVLHSQCAGCLKQFQVSSGKTLNTEKGQLHDINVRGVWGSMVSGGGCSSLTETLGTMGVPSVSQHQYSKLETQIGEWWGEILAEDMAKAAAEEKEHAIKIGSHFQGVPAITVICDGGWSKRSHKHTYNAMAGVGVIFGHHTGKLLHIGVKNRLCYVCSAAKNRNEDAKPHQCYKNWTESAQSMESQIILEGFLCCEEKYGVRYMKVIADGDSSVYANIQQQVPVWGYHVKKIECSNHSCKCLRVNLERLVDDKPQYKGKGQLSKSNIQKIVTGVRCAIRMRSAEENQTNSVKKLQQDIRNAGRHVLGLHNMCSTDFCKYSARPDAARNEDEDEEEEDDEDLLMDQTSYWKNSTADLEKHELLNIQRGGDCVKEVNESLLKDMYNILNRMADKADRIIGNFTSNLCESWMHIRCKFDGGKTVNRCFKGSFHARCYGGSLRSIKGPAWSPLTYTQVTGEQADEVYLQTYRQRAKSYAKTKRLQSTPKFKQNRSKRKLARSQASSTKKAKRHYGPEVLDDSEDLSPEELKKVTTTFFDENIKISEEENKNIEKDTRAQSGSEKWREERRKRLTSSVFGEVLSRNVKNDSDKLTNRLLYTNFKGNQFTQKGLREEENTRKEYQNIKDNEENKVRCIDVPGLVISKKYPHLAASSDGIVEYMNGEKGLIEIKNLLQTSDLNIKQAAKQQKQFCINMEEGELHLKRNHKYYYQIQGQLNILEMPWCDLVVRRTNPYDIFIERIPRDPKLWEEDMVPKLSAFYFTHIIQELAAPRKMTVSGIRKPKIPWFQSGEEACRKRKKPTPQKGAAKNKSTSSPKPSTSESRGTGSAVATRGRRQRTLKFLGRNIQHEWVVDETTGETKWYTGLVTDVLQGKDGEGNAVYEVQYEGEESRYEVEDLLTDYNRGSIKFMDV